MAGIKHRFILIAAATVVLVAAGISAAQTQTQPGATPDQAGYAGSEVCATCHEDVLNALDKTVHGSKAFATHSANGCETCHGPGQAHAESGDITLIRNPKKLKPQEASEICLGCHESGNQTHWQGGVHQQHDIACITCHSVHSFKSDKALLKTARVEDTCGTCHKDIRGQIQRTSHHPIREGLMTCTSCHNPHGTLTPKMIIANSVNEQCYECHTEKRGPFLWDHPPVRENCLNCHQPHGSNHEKLLAQNRPWLCQSCHLDTRHPGTLYDSTNQLTSNREFARSCSNCHLAIHGSNHPSGSVLTR